MKIIDLDEIMKIASPEEGSFRSKYNNINLALKKYGVEIPEHIARAARDMYQDITITTPYILEFIVNSLLDKAEDDTILIKNPNGIYNLCCGKTKVDNIIVEGDVGPFYGAFSTNKYHHIKGCAGRSFMDNAYSGKVVVEGIADDSAAQVNHGAKFLFKGYTGPRLGWAQRSGFIVTLDNLPFNAGLFMAGGFILTLGENIEAEQGPDMMAGAIYTPKATKENLGKKTCSKQLEQADYDNIASALDTFKEELDISDQFDPAQMMINGKRYDFSKYYKIVREQ